MYPSHWRGITINSILPSDAAPGYDCVQLRIKEAKTRGRAAKHQSSRIDQPDVVLLLSSVYGPLPSDKPLWPGSASTLRKRFSQLLTSLGLPTEKKPGCRPFDLGSLRPGGATYILQVTENSDLVRRRGRWVSGRVMEIYLQETAVSTFLVRLDPQSRETIESLAKGFQSLLTHAVNFLQHGVPPNAWHFLLRGAAAGSHGG